MKTIFFILCSMITITSLAQTKLIAFKSHSGNMDNFNIALENSLFDNEGSNFGIPSTTPFVRYKTSPNIVSVLYLSKSKVVVTEKVYNSENLDPKDSTRSTRLVIDTLYNDPLFSHKHSLDSIREAMKISGYYTTPVDKIIFIGYDNNNKLKANKKITIKNNSTPKVNTSPIIVTNDNDPGENSPFDTAMLKALAGIFLLALLGGWLSTKFYNLRLQKA